MVEDKNVSDLRNTLSLNHHWHDAVMDPTLETYLTLDVEKENIDETIAMLGTYSSGNRFKHLKNLEIEANDIHIHMVRNSNLEFLLDK